MDPLSHHGCRRAPPVSTVRRVRGFTLVELVVVIVLLGVLAAVAVPRYVDMGRQARVAAVTMLNGVLRSTADQHHVLCRLDPSCDYGTPYQVVTIGGQPEGVCYGWLDAGGATTVQVDNWVVHTGFTPVYAWPSTTFTLDDSPDPSRCAVNYVNAYWRGPDAGVLITPDTSGC